VSSRVEVDVVDLTQVQLILLAKDLKLRIVGTAFSKFVAFLSEKIVLHCIKLMAFQQHFNNSMNSLKNGFITAGNLYSLCLTTFSSIKEDTRSRERENWLKIAFLKKYFFAYYTNHTL
jgi:hypothetical protein